MTTKKDFAKPCRICGEPPTIQLHFNDGSKECYCEEHGIPEAHKQFTLVWKEMKGES